jgi:uncharacterized membrane protein YidH (DUF202 family)
LYSPYLANERTFLAYVRTSLSLAGAGLAVTQLLRLSIHFPTSSSTSGSLTTSFGGQVSADQVLVYSKVLGALFFVVGLLCLLMGLGRYAYNQVLIMEGLFGAGRLTVGVLAFCIFALTTVILSISMTLF